MMIFNSNCTIPPKGATFVAAPYIRGTLDIVWSCCSILLICTWSILHMNLPLQSTLNPNSRKEKYWRASVRFLAKAKWMLFNVLAPEWPLGKAWSDSISVKLVKDRFNDLKKEDQVPWSTTHTYFANMGGFGIKFSPANTGTNTESNLTTYASPQAPTRQSSVVLDGAAPRGQTLGFLKGNPTDTYPSEPIEIFNGTDRGRDQFDSIRVKLDGLLKRDIMSVDVLQKAMPHKVGEIDWHVDERNREMVAQALHILDWSHFRDPWEQRRFLVSYRDWFNRQRAQLEIMTFSFAICTGITYQLLIDKPKDVGYSIIILASRYPEATELIQLALLGPSTIRLSRRTIWIPNNALYIDHRDKPSYESQTNIALGSAFALVVFGCAHCIARNFAFLIECEQMLWKISSVFTASAVLTVFAVNILLASLISNLRPNDGRIRAKTLIESWVAGVLGVGLGIAFVVARGFHHI